MFMRIISFFLSMLLSIFPFFQKTQPVDNEAVAKAVIAAVEKKDEASLTALEDIMCLNIKQNTEDLPGKIRELIDCVEGEITEITWARKGAYSESDGKGKYVQQNYQGFHVKTTAGEYAITLVLETYNSFSAAEMGIRRITVGIKLGDPPHSNVLYSIAATEGIMDMHG